MRIAHICQSADPNVGGSLTVARALVREQRQHGLDARLVCLYRSEMTAASENEPSEIHLNVTRLSRWTCGIKAIRACLRTFAPHVIHHHDGILWPRVATCSLSAALVTHGHLGRPRARPLSAPYWIHRFIASRTDRLITPSEWVAASWRKGGLADSNIRVIPNGVHTDRFFARGHGQKMELRRQLGLPLDGRIVLWAGRLERSAKGLDRLLTLNQGPAVTWRLVIVGDGPDRTWLATEANRLPIVRLPLFVGKVPDTSRYFGAADAFLFTSRVESFGLVILEAAASALPIVAFPCDGGAAELLKRCRATMLADRQLSGALEAAAAVFPDAEALAAVAADVRANYSWAATASAVEDVYREILA